MTKKMEKKINACEMWIWRKMQRISWTEKKTNESVRMEIGIEEDETLQQTALRRKLGFFGHVMRSDGLEKRMMLAFEDGRRRRGRPRREWMDEIHEVTGMKLAELRDVCVCVCIYSFYCINKPVDKPQLSYMVNKIHKIY